jgi:predicted outer membrane repeat protein
MFKHVRRHGGDRPLRRLALAAIAGLGAMVLGAVPGVRPAQAASATVTNCNDSGPGSLRAAVAMPGVTSITFSVFCRPSSPIVLTSAIHIDSNVTINGGSPVLEAVSGNFSTGVFDVGFSNTAARVTISNLTIENGAAVVGGGIDNAATLTVNDVTFLGNAATIHGGGIFNDTGGVVTVVGSTFSTNHAPDGGGIFNFGTLTVRSTTFTGNTASGNGGAIANGLCTECQATTGRMTVTGSILTGNTARVGGGIVNFPGATATVTGTTINGNSASVQGGNVANLGTMTLSGDTVNANVAVDTSEGGGVYNNGKLTLTSSTLGGNTAGKGGGLFNDCGGTAVLTSDTVTNNTATGGAGSGGGIFNNPGTVTLVGTGNAVANNTPDNFATGSGCEV